MKEKFYFKLIAAVEAAVVVIASNAIWPLTDRLTNWLN